MYEIDFLPVGDGQDSGDAIALRFTRPDTGQFAVVTIDAGFQDDGDALVEHVQTYYETDYVDLAILTHPDGDHIGGMGNLVRGLRVERIWLHNIGEHAGGTLPAAKAVNDLITTAEGQGTSVYEAWAGAQAFGGALTILGPDRAYYDALVREQVAGPTAAGRTGALLEAARGVWDRVTTSLGIEVPFGEGEVNARNNSSMITLLAVDGQKMLFTADAGVPALSRGWDFAESAGLAGPLRLVQIPHHGSRRNGSSAWLDRLLGPTGQVACRTAFVSVVPNAEKHPSARIVNAHKRRGCAVVPTAGISICLPSADVPARAGWGPAPDLPPMDESGDEY